MSTRNDEIRLLLLNMLCGGRGADCEIMTGLGPQEWAALAAMARQHRLEPLLHRVVDSHPHWAVPEDIIRRWRRSFRRSALRALACEKVLAQVAARLDAAEIPYAALKGAWLTRHVYPHPALRPLRDIDILVPPEQAIAAFDLLKAEGFVQRSFSEPSTDHALVHGKHLPGLVSPAGWISIEIHHRLLTPCKYRDPMALKTDAVLGRCVRTNPGGIAFLAPTDTLLHLIIHAVYEHELCNGPLVITDIAYLLGTVEVDWDRLWQEAAHGGWCDGCSLLLRVVERYHAVRVPRPSSVAIPTEPMVQAAGLLMLQDHARRGRIALLSSLGAAPGLTAKLRLAARRATPGRHSLAAFAGVPLGNPNPWICYPAWLASRLRLTLGALAGVDNRADVRRARNLKFWLGTHE